MSLIYFNMIRATVLLSIVGALLGNSDVISPKRLPGDVIPLQYELEIIVNIKTNVYMGNERIKIVCEIPTNKIKLHIKGPTIVGDIYISEDASVNNKEVCVFTIDDANDLLIINLQRELKKGKSYILYLRFFESLSYKDEGFYIAKTNYVKFSTSHPYIHVTDQTYAATHIQTRARYFFPCFDEPKFIAEFAVRVGHHKSLTAVSNTEVISTSRRNLVQEFITRLWRKANKLQYPFLEDSEEAKFNNKWKYPSNTVWEKFQKTTRISPHQVVLIVGDFQILNIKEDIRLWFLKGLELSEENINIQLIPKITDFFNDYFQIKLPFKKINIISLPLSWFSAPYGTVIVPEETVAMKTLSVWKVHTIAHYLASQWVCGLVSIKWWSDLWYSFALSEHLATLALDQVLVDEGDKEIYNMYTYSRLETVYNSNKDEDVPVYKELVEHQEIIKHWNTNAFLLKGPFLMRMVHLSLGDKTFREGLKEFLREFQQKCADHNDMWNSLTKVENTQINTRHLNLHEAMKEWVTQAGYPVVTLRIKGTARGDQEVFLSQNCKERAKEEGDDSQNCWLVPITILSKTDTASTEVRLIPEMWLGSQERSFVHKQQCVILNLELAGLYKVNYDIDSWEQIAYALEEPEHSGIHVLNRAQLISDVLDLAKAGGIDYQTTFNLVIYLGSENSNLPWKVALKRLKWFQKTLFRTPKYDGFKSSMKYILRRIWNKFKSTTDYDDKVDKTPKMILKWACEYNVDACIKWTNELFEIFDQFTRSTSLEENPIATYLRRVVYCNGIKRGTLDQWNNLQDYFNKNHFITDHKLILHGLSCTTDPAILNKQLNWLTEPDGNLFLEERVYLITHIVAQEPGYDVAWNYLFDNVEKINNCVPNILTEYVKALVDFAASEDELNKLTAFIDEHHLDLNFLTATLDSTRMKLNWLEKL